jgi:YcaO-like protein with predicted kinase domain
VVAWRLLASVANLGEPDLSRYPDGAPVERIRALIESGAEARLSRDGRAADEKRAFERISAWATAHGITRLARTTLLDRIGIPNYYAVRPAAKNSSAIISSGKGSTDAAAILSSLFEALERWGSERFSDDVYFGTYAELQSKLPGWLLLFPASAPKAEPLFWVNGLEVMNDQPCLIPFERVVFPCAPEFDCGIFQQDTNGLASGTNAVEALCAAVLEIVERDVLAGLDVSNSRRVKPFSVSTEVGDIHSKFERADVEIALFACLDYPRIPVFFAISRDDQLQWPHLFCNGSGAHLDASIAATRALHEVSQSRATLMAGVREDIIDKFQTACADGFAARFKSTAHWFCVEEDLFGNDIHCWNGRTFGELLSVLRSSIRARLPDCRIGCSFLYASDGLYVVRAYSPDLRGLEE